jgi:hypothetical protein
MSWGEAWDLVLVLLTDPTSRIAAAVNGWAHPLSHEAQAVLDLFDLQNIRTYGRGKGKPKPHPRPWDPRPERYGKTDLSPSQAREALRRMARGDRPT